MSLSNRDIIGWPTHKAIAIPMGIWLVLGILIMFPTIAGHSFLPSTEWLARVEIAAIVAGLTSATYALFLCLATTLDDTSGGAWKVLNLLGGPLLAYFLGSNVVLVTPPMLLALTVGHEVELAFSVESADVSSSMRCLSPLKLEEIPTFFDQLCGIPADMREQLAPGDRIFITGHGTGLGIFADSLRRAK